MKKSPKVSIGMPVYNGGPFIGEALDTLLAQTFSDFELIISDNASSDETEAVCRKYAAREPRIRYVRHSENRGGLANFLFVLNAAAGEYFMWAAADDWWSDNWLAENVKNIEQGGVLLSFGKSVRTKIDLSIDGPVKCYDFQSNNVVIRLVKFFMLDENTKGNLFYGLIRKEVLQSIGIYLPQSKYGTEYPHIYKILTLGKIGCAEKSLLKKRNPISGVRRYKLSTAQLAIQYILGFKNVLNKDRFTYYYEFIKLTPSAFGKFLIATCVPIKILISIYYEYIRGAQSGLIILREKYENRIKDYKST